MLLLELKQVVQLAFVRVLTGATIMVALSPFLPHLNSSSLAQQISPRARAFPTTIQWAKQKGITKYRLQIADDENFRNIFYDGRVVGERYTVSDLAPGYYYWRIAPSERQTGPFLKPVRFFISGGVVISGIPTGSPAGRPRSPATQPPRVR